MLKLKEEREKLKDEGSKHEDKIMRENAKLQVNKRDTTLRHTSLITGVQSTETATFVIIFLTTFFHLFTGLQKFSGKVL